jgi:hypothetical protein
MNISFKADRFANPIGFHRQHAKRSARRNGISLGYEKSRGVLRADTDFDVPDSWPFTHVGYEWVGVGMLIMAAGH